MFQETSLIYLRAKVHLTAVGVSYHLSAVSFCCHRLKRRIGFWLYQLFPPQADAGAPAIFQAWDRAARIVDCQVEFYSAALRLDIMIEVDLD